MRRAVFLDRDGVLIKDTGLITDGKSASLMPGASKALSLLHQAGCLLIVVTNQSVLARGIMDEQRVLQVEHDVELRLHREGAPSIDGFYYCGHHPNATIDKWRVNCSCRKPSPGLLLAAARDLDVDLSRSYMVGDRPTDIGAGDSAGCRTVLVQTGRHLDPPIETSDPFTPPEPDMICEDLFQAAKKILQEVQP